MKEFMPKPKVSNKASNSTFKNIVPSKIIISCSWLTNVSVLRIVAYVEITLSE